MPDEEDRHTLLHGLCLSCSSGTLSISSKSILPGEGGTGVVGVHCLVVLPLIGTQEKWA